MTKENAKAKLAQIEETLERLETEHYDLECQIEVLDLCRRQFVQRHGRLLRAK